MNPRPSLVQALVLHDVADDGVWFDVISGKWHSTHLRKDVSTQMEILHRDGYIRIGEGPIPSTELTVAGVEALGRRPLGELVERLNRG